MAQRVEVILVDDLNGRDGDETVKFSLDGTDYEIDLTAANAEKLRKFLNRYVEAGRKVKKPRAKKAPANRKASS